MVLFRSSLTATALAFLVFFPSCAKAEVVSGAFPKAKGAESTVSVPAPASNTIVTFIELGSVNCVPCKAMQPVMDEVRQMFGEKVDVVFHDVWTDEGRPFGRKYGIRVI